MITTNDIICNNSVQILAYADDLDIIGRSRQAVMEAFVAIQSELEKMELTIKAEKSKFMIGNSQEIKNKPLVFNGLTFKNVTEFKYLGSTVTNRNEC